MANLSKEISSKFGRKLDTSVLDKFEATVHLPQIDFAQSLSATKAAAATEIEDLRSRLPIARKRLFGFAKALASFSKPAVLGWLTSRFSRSKAPTGPLPTWAAIAGLTYVASALIPLSKRKEWWVRVFDFPRSQFAGLGLLTLASLPLMRKTSARSRYQLAAGIAGGLALDAYRMYPYTKLAKREVVDASVEAPKKQLKLFTANVLQDNKDVVAMCDLIARENPDVILLSEVNAYWTQRLNVLNERYPFRILHPLENTYGIALYSRLELRDTEVRCLIAEDIPSILAKVKLRDGSWVQLFGVHPEPPRPDNGTSHERDLELILTGQQAAASELPVVVMGDLNDVAWSHTSRKFRRVSGLLDPRVGRGSFPTFPAKAYLFQFPLDYVFHSHHFELSEMQTLPDVGSDHLPFSITLQLK